MNRIFLILSDKACDAINDAMRRLPVPGGMIRYYDEESRSLAVLTIDKRDGVARPVAWSIFGALTAEEAAAEVAQLDAEFPGGVPVKH